MRVLFRSGVPALIIAGCLLVAYALRPRDSGVDIRVALTERCHMARCVQRPYSAVVRVLRVTTGEIVVDDRVDHSGRVRLHLDPGRYVLVPPAGRLPRRLRVAEVPVQVRKGRFASATVLYRRIR
jgi:hypothetical protein